MADVPMLDDQIRSNRRKSALILGAALVLLGAVVAAVAFLLALPWPLALGVGLAAGLLYVLVTASQGVSAVLTAARARPPNPAVREEKLLLHRVEEMSIAAGLFPPRVFVQDSRDINAFAAGKNPQEAVVCVTTGALRMLNQEELEGVVAHELSHIKNYDIRVATITVAVVGMVAILAEVALRGLWFGAGRGHGRGSRQGGPLLAVLLVLSLLLVFLAPLLSRLVYFAMSRRREYLADASGAMLTRNPEGLARALHQIQLDLPDDPKGSPTVAALYIANPWKRALRESLWSTHPPLRLRIERLVGPNWAPPATPRPPVPEEEPPTFHAEPVRSPHVPPRKSGDAP